MGIPTPILIAVALLGCRPDRPHVRHLNPRNLQARGAVPAGREALEPASLNAGKCSEAVDVLPPQTAPKTARDTEEESGVKYTRTQLVGAVYAVSATVLHVFASASAAAANEVDEPPVSLETVAKAAAIIPGYGQPDCYYPPFFAGAWVCTRELVSVSVAPGSMASSEAPELAEAAKRVGEELTYKVLFVRRDENVVADRAYNERALLEARVPGSVGYMRWEPANPNVLAIGLSGGRVREVKVTKRSFEAPSADTYGTSEYARIATATADAGLSSVPAITAARTLVRYRRTGADDIEAIELVKYYPAEHGFGGEPQPLGVVRSRLTLRRAAAPPKPKRPPPPPLPPRP